jgi:hypothetical protein
MLRLPVFVENLKGKCTVFGKCQAGLLLLELLRT